MYYENETIRNSISFYIIIIFYLSIFIFILFIFGLFFLSLLYDFLLKNKFLIFKSGYNLHAIILNHMRFIQ